jgi:Restriction endonuclease
LGNLLESKEFANEKVKAVVLDMHIRGVKDLSELRLPKVDTVAGEAVGLAIAEQYLTRSKNPFRNTPIAFLTGFSVQESVARRIGALRERGTEVTLLSKGGDLRRFEEFIRKVAGVELLSTLCPPEAIPPRPVIKVLNEISSELMLDLKNNPGRLHNVSSRDFEKIVAELLASMGWSVDLTPATRDGGYDIFAVRRDLAGIPYNYIVECKRFAPHRKIGVGLIRELYGAQAALEKGANLLLATTSFFTRGAKKFESSRYDLTLRDYEGILEWINAYKPHPGGRLYMKNNRLIIPN